MSGMVSFSNTNKTAITFIETALKNFLKSQDNHSYSLAFKFYLDFMILLNFLISGKKMLMSGEISVGYKLLDLLKLRYKSAKLSHCRYG